MTLKWPWDDPISRAFDVVEHRPIDFNESKRRIFDDSAATQGGSEEWKPNAYQVRPRVKSEFLLEFFKFGFEYDDGTKNIIENPKFSPKISPKFHHFEIKYKTRWDKILPRGS